MKNEKPVTEIIQDSEIVTEKAPERVADVKPEGHKLWEERMWSGVKKVFMCKKCEEFFDEKDDIITHVVGHAPKNEQSKLLDQLIKE